MFKTAIRGAAIAVLTSASAAAADLPMKAPVQALPGFSWAGTYLGIVGTAGLMASDMSANWCRVACDGPDMGRWGGGIGVTLGHNMQYGSLVYGVEADVSWARFRQSLHVSDGNFTSITNRAEWDWYATLRGRIGLSFDHTLIYATGGAAFVGADYSNRQTLRFGQPANEGYTFSDTQVGVAAGVGVEKAFGSKLSLKAEYLYIGLPSVRRPHDIDGAFLLDDFVMTWKSHAHLMRVGLNYRWADATIPVLVSTATMPMKAIPPSQRRPLAAYNWAGTYIGAVGTAGIMGTEMSGLRDETQNTAPDMARWGGAAGLTLGHNIQSAALVYGVEADASWSWFQQSSIIGLPGIYALKHQADWDWYATARGRLGLAFDRSLFYVTGGAAFVGAEYSNRYRLRFGAPTNEGFSFSDTQIGIAAGAGVEHALTGSISLKAEYLYVGLPHVKRAYVDNGVVNTDEWMIWKSNAHLLRLGLNHHFNAAPPQAAAPAVNWTGTYVGGVASVGMMGTEMSNFTCVVACDVPDMARWGGALGLTLGHNMQSGEFVYGAEIDGSWTSFQNGLSFAAHSVNPGEGASTHQAEWDWYLTARARVGLAVDRTLAYVTGGAALVDVRYFNLHRNITGDFGAQFDGTRVGVAAGTGVEHAVSPQSSFKFEYLYIGLPSVSRNASGPFCDPPSECPLTWRSDAHQLRFGWNYRLGSLVAAGY